jgi:hypothetical protein
VLSKSNHLRSTGATADGTSTVGEGLACRSSTELSSRTVGVDGTCDCLSREKTAQMERMSSSASGERK